MSPTAIDETQKIANACADIVPHGLNTDDVYRMVFKDRSKIETIHFHFTVAVDMKKYEGVAADKLVQTIARDKLQAAIERSKRYCDSLRLRFIHCDLFLVDLDERERISAQNY